MRSSIDLTNETEADADSVVTTYAGTVASDAHASGTSAPGDHARTILESVRDLQSLLADYAASPDRHDHVPVAESTKMRQILVEAQRIAASKASVLIEGETGTGKELVARLVHFSSPRALKPFVRVNCAALSETLAESEFFGHEKGAYTGATDSRAGRFELANGGTILLDEIGEMPLKLQAKLLRVLEEQEFERVGGSRTLHVDVRVIATTNRCLEHEVANGRFRADLYYRLNVVRIYIPPLRERPEEIPALVAYFMWKFQNEGSVPIRSISPKALQMLLSHQWTGNIREFRNVIQRACVHAQQGEIRVCDLAAFNTPAASHPAKARLTLEEIERDVILTTLRELGGNKTAAAARLGVTPRTLLNKMNRYRAMGVIHP